MSAELLPYYNRELAYFRRASAEFARAHPKIAARLRIGEESTEDPHVERLIEAVAFLTARIRQKIDDDFPELTDALIGVLYPHFLAPIPSMSIIELQPSAAQAPPPSGYEIPRETQIETEAIRGEPCRFRTCYDVTLWPMTIHSAAFSAMPTAAPQTPRSRQAEAVVRISAAALGDETVLGDLTATSLRFFLKGMSQHVMPLYQLLCNHAMEVAIADGPNDPQPLVLPGNCIRPVGFDADQAAIPADPRCADGYRLLTEYFAFPQKFQFLDITGIEPAALAHLTNRLEIYIYLDEPSLDLEQNVTTDTFRLGCTPMVNLFRQRAEPISTTHATYEYRVAGDARRPEATEVYAVHQVTAVSPDERELTLSPFYSTDHLAGQFSEQSAASPQSGAYYLATRRSSDAGEDAVDHGTEIWLSLVDLTREPIDTENWYLDIETTCLNRDLPNRLPFGGDQPRLFLTEGEGPVHKVVCLTAPTPTRRPARGQGALWRLISHLSLNHRSIVGGREGAAALREILRIYDLANTAQSRSALEGIVSVDSRRVTGRVPGRHTGAFCRGVEVTITFDPDRYDEGGVFLLASVLDCFLGNACSVNSFTRLIARLQGKDEILHRWPDRTGERVLL